MRLLLSDDQGAQSASRGAAVLRWASRLFVIAGAAMLVWSALLLGEAGIAQRVARQSLEIAPDAPAPISPRGREETGGLRLPAPTAVRGSAIAALSIPRVDLSAVVLHGSDNRTLRRGPGHVENTALPGEPGNAVIAGHRDSFFRPLRNVRLGDDIFVETRKGRFHYQVTSLRVVNAHDVSVLEPTDDAMLTLITCYPFWVLGQAPDRFIVRATRVVDPATAALATRDTSPPESIAAPVVQRPAANESAAQNTPVALDDEALVQQAIERFRLTYNARLISHGDLRPGGPLGSQACDVTFDGDEAAATCGASSQSPNDHEPPIWTATLRRGDSGWAIRTIVLQ
jgi:sortase A